MELQQPRGRLDLRRNLIGIGSIDLGVGGDDDFILTLEMLLDRGVVQPNSCVEQRYDLFCSSFAALQCQDRRCYMLSGSDARTGQSSDVHWT